MMTRLPSDQQLQMSVLDRLMSGDGVDSAVLRDLRAAVRRDLENLLNTRWRNRSFPNDLKDQLETSLVNYGIPDFTGENFGSPGSRKEFLRQIERLIQLYEPRLMRVRVEPIDYSNMIDRTFRFRVEGVLRVKPSPERVAFDTSLEPATATFHVEQTH